MDFHKIFSKSGTWGKQQSGTFWDIAFNPLNPGLIFLFSGFVLLKNIAEEIGSGFSWIVQETSGMMHEITI